MIRSYRILLVAVVLAGVGLGCAKPPAPVADNGQVPALEAKVRKLEHDLKAVTADRDGLKGQLAAADAKWRTEVARGDELRAELAARTTELKARTTERDAVQARFDGFRDKLKDMLGAMAPTAHARAN